jgi:hypothetical protein
LGVVEVEVEAELEVGIEEEEVAGEEGELLLLALFDERVVALVLEGEKEIEGVVGFDA